MYQLLLLMLFRETPKLGDSSINYLNITTCCSEVRDPFILGKHAFRALTSGVHIGMPNKESEDAGASSKYFETMFKNHSSNAMNEEGNNFKIENLNADVSTFWRRTSMKEDTLV